MPFVLALCQTDLCCPLAQDDKNSSPEQLRRFFLMLHCLLLFRSESYFQGIEREPILQLDQKSDIHRKEKKK